MKLDASADHSSFIDFINEFSVLLEVTTLAFSFLLLFLLLPLIIVFIIGSTDLGGPWPLFKQATSILGSGHPISTKPVSLRLPLIHHSIFILVDHVLVAVQGLSIISF
jgi:hypothetical protein